MKYYYSIVYRNLLTGKTERTKHEGNNILSVARKFFCSIAPLGKKKEEVMNSSLEELGQMFPEHEAKIVITEHKYPQCLR